MRLICPKCSATYDIPTKAIPLDGREVQCSSCTHTWYQLPLGEQDNARPLSLEPQAPAPKTKAAPAGDNQSILPYVKESEAERISKQIERLRGALSQESQLPQHHSASGAAETAGPDVSAGSEAKEDGAPPAPRRKIDPQVLEVLREEAVRESRARKEDPPSIMNTQPDLGLGVPPRRPVRKSEGIREKLARLQAAERGEDQPTPWVRETPGQTAPKTVTPAKTEAAAPAPEKPERPEKKAEPKPRTAAPSSHQPAQKNTLVPTKKGAGLPVALSSRELALIVEKKERVQFRWGFAATAGLSCLALAVYLSAAPLARSLPEEQRILELVAEKGAVVQDKLATGVRAAIAALGAKSAEEG